MLKENSLSIDEGVIICYTFIDIFLKLVQKDEQEAMRKQDKHTAQTHPPIAGARKSSSFLCYYLEKYKEFFICCNRNKLEHIYLFALYLSRSLKENAWSVCCVRFLITDFFYRCGIKSGTNTSGMSLRHKSNLTS